MEELYLKGSNLWLIDQQLSLEVSNLFKTIPFARKDLSLEIFIVDVRRIIENIKKIVEYIKNQQENEAKRLLEEANIFDATDNNGETALMQTASRGHYEIVEMLLAEKANPDIHKSGGWTAANLALYYSGREYRYERYKPYIFTLAVLYKSNPNLKDNNSHILHSAVRGKSSETIRLFLEAGANPNVINENDGETPLHRIAQRYIEGDNPTRKREIVLLLLNARAIPNLEDKRHRIPLDHVWDSKEEENNKIAWLLVYYLPEKIYARERIKTACQEVYPTDLCDIIADYYPPDEISPEIQKRIPKNTYTLSEVQELQEEKKYKRPSTNINRPLPIPALKHEGRYDCGFFPRISCRPLVMTGITGSLGLGGLFLTAFTTKDLLPQKAFYPILMAEAVLMFFIVYLTYRLASHKEAVQEQSKMADSTRSPLLCSL
jgi:Ankyrin repeats (3 copies)/Ankyrin repeat